MTNCWNFFGGFVKTAFLVSMETFFNFLRIWCFSYRVRTLSEKHSVLSRKISAGLPKLLSMFHRNISKKSAFPQKIMSLLISFGKSRNLRLFAKKLDRSVKTAFCLSIGQFWGNRFSRKYFGLFIIFGLRANFSQFLSDIFWGVFKAAFYVSIRTSRRKKISFWKKL